MSWLKFNQYQTRVPTGYRGGGQWSSTGSSREGPSAQRLHSINRVKKPKPIKKPKPLRRLPSGKPVIMRFQQPIEVSQAELNRLRELDPPLQPVYLFESLAGLGALGRALLPYATRQIAAVVSGALEARRSTARIQRAAKAIEEFLGGKPEILDYNKHGDLFMVRGNKKVRFDIKNTHPHPEPHFHLQRRTASGNWVKATPSKRYPFKKD